MLRLFAFLIFVLLQESCSDRYILIKLTGGIEYTGLKEGIRNSTLHCSKFYGPMSSTRALI